VVGGDPNEAKVVQGMELRRMGGYPKRQDSKGWKVKGSNPNLAMIISSPSQLSLVNKTHRALL